MNKEIRSKLGERIRELRKSAGFTQEKFGGKTGLSYKYIGELERGQVNVSLNSIVKIAEALGVKVGDLFSEERIHVQKVFVRERNTLLRLSPQNIHLIKKALTLLNKTFSKV